MTGLGDYTLARALRHLVETALKSEYFLGYFLCKDNECIVCDVVHFFFFSWLREFIDDPYRGHVALVEFLQYLHLNQPTPEDPEVLKRKGKPDVLARSFVSSLDPFSWDAKKPSGHL